MSHKTTNVRHLFSRNAAWRSIYLANLIVITIVLGALSATKGHAASFDCKKAGTQVEKAICATPKLGQLDEDLMAAYKKVAATEKQSQRAWLEYRNTCGPDLQCLIEMYKSRIAVLERAARSQISTSSKNLLPVIPKDKCAVITMASKDDSAVLAELSKYWDFEPVAIRSNNGYTAAAIGIYPKDVGIDLARKLKAEDRIPTDSYCGNTERYIQIVYPNHSFSALGDYSNASAAPAVSTNSPTPVIAKTSDQSTIYSQATKPTQTTSPGASATANLEALRDTNTAATSGISVVQTPVEQNSSSFKTSDIPVGSVVKDVQSSTRTSPVSAGSHASTGSGASNGAESVNADAKIHSTTGTYLGEWIQGEYFKVAVKGLSETSLPPVEFVCQPAPTGSRYVMVDIQIENIDSESRTMLTEGELHVKHNGKSIEYDQTETCTLGQDGFLNFMDDIGPFVVKEGKITFIIPNRFKVGDMVYLTPRDGQKINLKRRPN